MFQFDAVSFFWFVLTLQLESEMCSDHARQHPNTQLIQYKDDMSRIRQYLQKTRNECAKLGLTFTVKHLERMLEDVSEGKETFEHMAVGFEELIHRISDEVEEYLFFGIPRERASFYKDAIEKFGQNTVNKFPSIRMEVEEAGKCYATGRYTACAFHLMRVIEVGLRALGKSLNDPTLDPSRNPSWEAILKKCDIELQKPFQDRIPEWRTDPEFFNNATANLRAVKDAWRNPTMHIEHIYDEEKSLDLFNKVSSFMRYLATKLNE